MRRIAVYVMMTVLLTGCGQERGDVMEFSVSHHNSSVEQELSREEQTSKEEQLRDLLENAAERVRLLYFQEELEEDLLKEQAITVQYDESQTIDSDVVGTIEFDRIIIFGSGRLKADNKAEYVTVITTNEAEIALWNCLWSDLSEFDFVQ